MLKKGVAAIGLIIIFLFSSLASIQVTSEQEDSPTLALTIKELTENINFASDLDMPIWV